MTIRDKATGDITRTRVEAASEKDARWEVAEDGIQIVSCVQLNIPDAPAWASSYVPEDRTYNEQCAAQGYFPAE